MAALLKQGDEAGLRSKCPPRGLRTQTYWLSEDHILVHEAWSETLSVTSFVLSLHASGDVLVHLLLETTCSVLMYLTPKYSSNAYDGTENWPNSESQSEYLRAARPTLHTLR